MSDSEETQDLPDDIYDQVTERSEAGNERFDEEDYQGAIDIWTPTLDLLPDPKRKWEAALWLHASIGDAQRQLERKEAALTSFQSAYNCADGHTNPFVLFSLGICLFDLERKDEAKDHLLRAYMLDGDRMFENEEPQYLQLLKDQNLING